ncbi:archaeal proteasome endopeptidase complex subunit alpha [Candidatus Woesearchaeota archaeon]|nr:archaeal proteasome endopeptidase complex subunit alpha [Candidatus Woesearchaeota archaeon]
MQPLPHQIMGYDRAITMFSPDGRLLQVEYAKKTVKQGSTAVGLVCSDGVLLVADKRIVNKLIIPESVQKVFEIDHHIAAAASGILSDARVLIDRSQVKAQQHRVSYDTEIDVISVVKDISALKQLTTQSGGLRPFGVSLLIAGVDKSGPQLYQTDPTAIYFAFKAAVIGESDVEVNEVLQKEYKENMTIDDGLQLIIKTFHKIFAKNFNVDRIEAAYIPTKNPQFTAVPRSTVEKIVKDLKKK